MHLPRFARTKRIANVVALSAALSLSPTPAMVEASSLPDMGDASGSVLTPEREQRIGKAMWRQLHQAGKIIDAPELAGYVRSLGYRLLAAGEYGPRDFTFFLVDAPSINAFAMPGGYIGIHAGLITATQNEDEVAAVMAHEIAHVTQNHLARGYEKANRMNLPMTAAVIAAILLGAQNPQLAEATIAATTAGAAQMQLDFTRAHEKEADRLGIDTLAAAGYDPRSMAGFFRKLEEQSRYYGSGVPEFLRTHPVNQSRIADAEGRARVFPDSSSQPQTDYWITKARLEVHLSDDPAALARRVDSRLDAGRSTNRHADRFTLALALRASGELGAARKILKAFVEEAPERIAYRTELARLEMEDERYDLASQLLETGLELYPDNPELLLALGEIHLHAEAPEKARRRFERAIRTNLDTAPETYKHLSRAEAALGHEAASRLALGEYYFRIGETHSAIDQLTAAQDYAGNDFYIASRIGARLKQFKREAELESQD
ncbi:M48 family metalloprotease [Thiohalomonas denitrificans]|uniref:Putative beta-barrel assembly-enhancing protease n=1 Tax=Thiohalomonas denitrificans TaxID=415747 RepID=A0A1G5PZL3_9GAMM|nr:M48 family metalloprotease [Thiohalomonas denitrificans]SCZ54973.1 Putative Zn-dependent protease, contains TPR repeats [Thiohalomonas denitrificans]